MTPETLLLRQIHPSFVQAGRVTSQAFRPTPKDGSLLSITMETRLLRPRVGRILAPKRTAARVE
jgi:hypothetical protein